MPKGKELISGAAEEMKYVSHRNGESWVECQDERDMFFSL